MSAEISITTRSIEALDRLLCEVARGDRASFQTLYAATSARIYGLIRRVLVDAAQSDEVTQEVFLEIWQLAKRYDPERARATTWMSSIAHRRAIDRVRASESSRARDLKIGIRDYPHSIDEVPEQVEIKIDHERATRALDCLSVPQRQVLKLAYWDGFSTAEIAVVLGVKRSTATTRLQAGLLKLRLEMERS